LQIFPPGREVQFTAQEIYNGYTHLYVNLMNLPAEFFEENFGHIFQELAYGMGQKIVRGNPSFEVMSKRVRIALERVNQLPMPPREKVRRR
jgi:poly-beta-hydroxyalkanoate depolymerase